MIVIKKYSYILYFILFLLISSFVLGFVNLLFGFSNRINSILCFISIVLFVLFTGLKLGMKSSSSRLTVGIVRGIIYILILYSFNCLFISFKIGFKTITYYLIIMCFNILGFILGVNKKKV